ncbi:Cell wall-binding protein YocH precursor [compost metagenome]
MKSICKGLSCLVLSFAVLSAGSLISPLQAHAALEVKVQVNENLVVFPDAQPYIDHNERTLVPLRFVTEKLGYKLDWKKTGDEISVSLNNASHALTLTTGQKEAWIDGTPVTMDSAAEYEQGRVYVPLRFLSTTASMDIDWHTDSRLAILSADGKSYNPDYSVFQATAYSADASENGGYGALDYMGNSLKLGTVAVDPKVIPLGSKLYIEGYNFAGLPAGGMYAYATDTGGAVKGKKVDIFIPGSAASLRKFGIQQVKVYQLSPYNAL